jgi:peptidoglycan/LPS O-acetylase OafA/YrhL
LGAIDGLRGYLAIFVFFHHVVVTYYWKRDGYWGYPPEPLFKNLGTVGVSIFFMITGYLFITKVFRDKGNTHWGRMLSSRMFRILPLYFFVLAALSLIVFAHSGWILKVSISELLSQYGNWLLFEGVTLNNYVLTTLITSQVEWTLQYEWFFYLCLPLVAFILHRGKITAWLLLLVLIAGVIFNQKIGPIETKTLNFFVVGGLTAYLVMYYPQLKLLAQQRWVSYFMLVPLLASLFMPKQYGPLYVVFLPFFFVPVALGNDLWGLLSTKASVVLGEISYSIYLMHGIILFVLFTSLSIVDLTQITLIEFLLLMPLMTGLVIVISTCTYLQVEAPNIALGRKLTNR